MQLRPYQSDLIQSARDAMQAGSRRVLIVAPCGAGKTILSTFMGSEHVQRGGRVLFLAHRRELLEQAEDTFRRAGQSTTGITIMSVQTAARRIGTLTAPTMILLDEAHHAAAGTWQTILTAFPDAYVVGLTATPCRLDGKGLGDIFERMVQGVTTDWLVDNRYLSPYRYYAPQLADATGIHTVAGDFNKQAVAELMDNPAIIGDAVEHYTRIVPGKQAIVYCASIDHSRHTAAAFTAAGYRAAHLDGDTPGDERTRIIRDFRDRKIMILSNVDLLGEGFDVPACDATIMLRPTQSTALYIQQSMRCMRYVPEKTAVIIDHVGNCGRHGFPDDDRAWELTTSRIKRKPPPTETFLTCENCYAVYIPPPYECPYCGQEANHKQRQQLEQHDGDLGEITKEMREAARKAEQKKKRTEEGMARSFEDFRRIAQERGYKPYWAVIRARERGYLV
jgi:DNA repair protein RadD